MTPARGTGRRAEIEMPPQGERGQKAPLPWDRGGLTPRDKSIASQGRNFDAPARDHVTKFSRANSDESLEVRKSLREHLDEKPSGARKSVIQGHGPASGRIRRHGMLVSRHHV